MVPSVVVLPRAEAQIIDVLGHTLDAFGEAKYVEYRELIEHALSTLAATPTAGKRRSDIHPTRGRFTSLVRADGHAICFCIAFATASKLPGFSTTRWICLASDHANGSELRR